MARWMVTILMIATMVFSFGGVSLAKEKATPSEVYEMILKGLEVLESLGEEGLAAFNDPKGEFVWKDSYVFVIDCESMKILAHPKKKRIGADLSNNQDKHPDPAKKKYHNRAMCEIAKNPMGGWIDYYWWKLGDDKPSRKISFVLKSQSAGYVLVAGIYNDDADVERMNAELK